MLKIAVAGAFVVALLAFPSSHAVAGVVYSVSIDTSGFDLSGNPYQLDVNLVAANGSGDASSVTLDNFSCSGCPAVAQSLIDATFLQDLYIPFTAGGTISFDLSLTPDLTGLATTGPDSFQLSILDQSYTAVTTTDPYAAVLFAALDSASPTVDSFGSPVGSSPALPVPSVVQEEAPEPNSALLTLAVGALCLLGKHPARRTRRATRLKKLPALLR